MWNKSEITFAQIFPRGTAYQSEYDTKETKKLAEGYQCQIEQTWDNRPIDHTPISIDMKWHFERVRGAPHKRVIKVSISAPLFDDPEPPFEPGPTDGLWNYEVVELFFANDQGNYLEIEVGPHGHWLCLLFKGQRQCINDGKDIDLLVENVFDMDVWKCELEIPLAYLPGRVTKFNAYAIHGTGKDRVYEALHPMTDKAFPEPDFHRLQYFKRIDTARFIPESYNYRPFVDMKYGNMWRAVVPDDDDGETSAKKPRKDDDNAF
uniref:UPF0462 protein C4orf33 homolog n=1 Tax=Panagrellus redivivus TaxID=6233 RepID=A0A7E4VQK6_PANRE